MLSARLDDDRSSWRGSQHIIKCEAGGESVGIAITSHSPCCVENMIKAELQKTTDEGSRKKDGCEINKLESVHSMVKVDVESAMLAADARRVISNDECLGSLSNELATIGHIDSSETSDDSPEGKCVLFNVNTRPVSVACSS